MRQVTDRITLLGDDRKYEIRHTHGSKTVIQLQQGNRGPAGQTNGCRVEDLIAVCIDRLEVFQAGTLPCDENDDAIKYL